jgi:triacylglycerol lipase
MSASATTSGLRSSVSLRSVFAAVLGLGLSAGCGAPQGDDARGGAASQVGSPGELADGSAAKAGRAEESQEGFGVVKAQRGASKFPVVLHHGFLGYDRIFTIDYFYGVRARLEGEGFLVKASVVSPANSVAYRAKQLARQVDELLAKTGAAKVNIVAHSMGGLDARYMISTLGYGDRVASLTMISTPNDGTSLADLALDLDDSQQEAAVEVWRSVVGTQDARDSFHIPGVGAVDLWAAIRDLATGARAEQFNAANPDDARVYYQSFAGITSPTGLTTGDAVCPLLSVSYVLEKALEGDNDGVVSVRSARWGHYRGEVPADHMNEVGHPFGATSWLYDHRDFYSALAHEFVAKGF